MPLLQYLRAFFLVTTSLRALVTASLCRKWGWTGAITSGEKTAKSINNKMAAWIGFANSSTRNKSL